MGGSERTDWADALDAAFEAALEREEEAAAADLAFSLRQDVDVREAVRRSGCAWTLVGAGESRLVVDEVGIDYVKAGAVLSRTGTAVLRSAPGPSPRTTDARFLEILGAVARTGADVVVGEHRGRLARVGRNHLALRKGEVETIVGLEAVRVVRLDGEGGYSASRGLSG